MITLNSAANIVYKHSYNHFPHDCKLIESLINNHINPKLLVLHKVFKRSSVNKMLITCVHNTISSVECNFYSFVVVSVIFLTVIGYHL